MPGVTQLWDQALAGLCGREAAGVEAKIRHFGVERGAVCSHLGKHSFSIRALQKGAHAIIRETLELFFYAHGEVKHIAAFAHECAALGAQHCAAARGNEAAFTFELFGQLARFAIAKAGFALSLENHGHGHARRGLNGVVKIDKHQAEALGQALADGGFARPHGADEDKIHSRIHGVNVSIALHFISRKPPMALRSPRSVLIAGAGDTGLRLAALAASRGWEALALRRREVPIGPGIRALRANLATGEGFDQLPKRPDALVFCAAPDERTEAAYRALYRDGMRRLLDSVEIGRVLFVSSTAVYSEDSGGAVDEDTPADATAFNGRVLLEAEKELDAHGDAAAFRASGIYGPGRERMWNRAQREQPGEKRWTNRIHVDDVAGALMHLLDATRISRLYCGNDDAPTLEYEVIDGLRARLGLAALGAADGPVLGKRVLNARLRGTGWVPRFSDWRSGYAAHPSNRTNE